jgi:hypothetical protein
LELNNFGQIYDVDLLIACDYSDSRCVFLIENESESVIEIEISTRIVSVYVADSGCEIVNCNVSRHIGLGRGLGHN